MSSSRRGAIRIARCGAGCRRACLRRGVGSRRVSGSQCPRAARPRAGRKGCRRDRVFRRSAPPASPAAARREERGASGGPATAPPGHTEIVSFGTRSADRVTVIRGGAVAPVSPARPTDPAAEVRVEQVSFADPRQAAVTVVRGPEFARFLRDRPVWSAECQRTRPHRLCCRRRRIAAWRRSAHVAAGARRAAGADAGQRGGRV